MAEFSLSAVISAVVTESIQPKEVDALTQEVLGRIRKTDQRAALEQALPQVIRAHMRLATPSFQMPRDDALVSATSGTSGATAERAQPAADSLRRSSSDTRGGRPPSTSSKAERYRLWFAKLQWVQMKGADGSEKYLKDFTVADVRAAADRRRLHAERTMAAADSLYEIADYMEHRGLTYWSEIPESVLDQMATEDIKNGDID